MQIDALVADHNPWWSDPTARTAASYLARRRFQRVALEFVREEDRRALVVLGPRQVGKTVALRQLADDLLTEGWPAGNLTYFDFSDDRLLEPCSPRDVLAVEPSVLIPRRPRLLLLDEIQRAIRWQDWLKQSVDQQQLVRVVATGSFAGALREGGLESGQGRWDEIQVGGLTFAEHVDFRAAAVGSSRPEFLRREPNELERYLHLGGFPEHVFEDDLSRARARIRADIADRAIARDLAATGIDVDAVRRLFVYLAAESGSIFGASKRARDLGVDERSIKSWIDRLENAQLIASLAQHSRGSKRLRAKPKLYAADHGLVTSFAASPAREHAVFARAVETCVFRHLREAHDAREDLRYFRSDADVEGDFIVGTESEPIVLEITSSTEVKPEKIIRVREVGKIIRTRRLVIGHLGFRHQVREGVKLLPLERLLLTPEALRDDDG